MVKTIELGKGVIHLKKLSARQQAIRKHPKLVPTLEKTAVGLGLTLGALLNPAAAAAAARGVGRALVPKSARGFATAFIGVPTAVGVLSQSKKARAAVKTALDPREAVKRGQKIGDIIEEPSKASDILGIKEGQTAKEKIVSGLKTGGKVGAVLAGGLAVAAAAKKGKQILDQRKAAKAVPSVAKELGFTDPQPVGLGGVPVSVGKSPQIKPTEAPQSKFSPQPIHNIIQIAVR